MGNRRIALRIDVDTFRGTRLGVPRLLQILAERQILASFFFSVGPDNMGRHLTRLLRPAFLLKMLRSNAAKLYGWDILLAGTFWPGRKIGQHLSNIIRQTAAEYHEVGLHAWDHHAWQKYSGQWDRVQQYRQIKCGYLALEKILSRPPCCSAAAGWRATNKTMAAKADFPFLYNSDCRGDVIFRPRLADHSLGAAQIPVDLPTYDEVIGHLTTTANYNAFILQKFAQAKLGVYTIHAEVEGILLAEQFAQLLDLALAEGFSFMPLSALLPDNLQTLPIGRIVPTQLTGREGWLAGIQIENI